MHDKLIAQTPLLLAAITAVTAVAGNAQPPAFDGATGGGDTSIFAPLELGPPPSQTRSSSGAPGSKYWQNRADYDLHATLDTAKRALGGSLVLRYTNHSPDTLAFLWLQTEQNAFKAGSLNSLVFPSDSRFGARDFDGGETFDRFEQVVAGKRVALTLHEQGTITKVTLATPLAPGQTAVLEAEWHFPIPEHGADRMGRDGRLYQMAQWYPRVCVYDDVKGWNIEPYLGQGEFYLEYGDYTLSVTLPAGYTVAATGTLDNPHEVLTPAEIARLARAAKSDTTVAIISAEDLRTGTARPRQTGTLTWKFRAKNVRDVAWVASPDYLWDASSWQGILAMAYYRPGARETWKDAADMSRESIREYSERWFRYPYPQISAVEGTVYGMEYPMLAMEGAGRDKYDLFGVITHEIGHNWFPMIVGSNERVHAWQDEGFNTFINTFAEAKRYPEKGSQQQLASVRNDQAVLFPRPIEIAPDRVSERQLYFGAYYKPSAGLQILREYVLGPKAFDDAFRTYIKRWAFKHPTPADFYRTVENVAGQRLDWFWREWFIENPQFDQGIDTVMVQPDGATGRERVAIQYGNYARGVLPLLVRFTFADGTTDDVVYPAEVWSTNSRAYVRQYHFVKKLTRVDIDPDRRLGDVNRANNNWTAGT